MALDWLGLCLAQMLQLLMSVFAPDEVQVDEIELQAHAEKFLMIPDGILGAASDVSQQEREKMLGFVYDISDPKQGMAAVFGACSQELFL